MVIGIAGTLGAGKGTVVQYLKNKGFSHYSSSGTLKDMLKQQGLAATRKNLSALADELADENTGGIVHFLHEQALRDGAKKSIFEAIHREKEADFIHKLGGKVLGVDADIEMRYERITKRKEGEKDDVTFEQFLNDSKREDEGKAGGTPNIRAVLAKADFVVTNNGTVEELHSQIDEALEKLLKK